MEEKREILINEIQSITDEKTISYLIEYIQAFIKLYEKN